jgi:hypothetical protein
VDSIERVLFPPTVIDATPKTFGSQADRNEGPGRRYWLDKQRHDHEEARGAARRYMVDQGLAADQPKYERPWWRDSDVINTELTKLTPEEKTNYIMTGNSNTPLTPEITS